MITNCEIIECVGELIMIDRVLAWADLIVWSIMVIIMLIITYYTLFVAINRNRNVVGDEKENRFAILIPARNESKVIENILISIEKQTYRQSMEDVYVIVESAEDPSVEIVTRHGGRVFVRTELENRHRKGYALDECIRFILSQNIHYDAYFIFDADNTLKEDYFEQMNSTFNKGYDLACGYRQPTNPDETVVSTCSALIFSMINVFGNVERAKKNYNVTITGTGFYIRGSLVEELGGYPFHTLTEDYELTMYATWKGLSSTYNENAVYMDEQPTTWKMSKRQRLRWVKGYIEARKLYGKKIQEAGRENKDNIDKRVKSLGVLPFAVMLSLIVVYVLFCLCIAIASLCRDGDTAYIGAFWRIGGVLIGLYLLLCLFTICMFSSERKKTHYRLSSKIKAVLMNPFFLAGFIPLIFKALCSDKIGWDEIEHKGK